MSTWMRMQHPEKGNLIPQSGGLRKIRWKVGDKGNGGGIGIIYYYKTNQGQIWVLTVYDKTVYDKNEQANIPIKVLKELRNEVRL